MLSEMRIDSAMGNEIKLSVEMPEEGGPHWLSPHDVAEQNERQGRHMTDYLQRTQQRTAEKRREKVIDDTDVVERVDERLVAASRAHWIDDQILIDGLAAPFGSDYVEIHRPSQRIP